MKIAYQGYELEAKREKTISGDVHVFFSVMKGSREITSGFYDGTVRVREAIADLKIFVDEGAKR